MTVAKELSKYKLDLVGVQEVRWDRDDTEPTDAYVFVYGKGNQNRELCTGFLVHKRIISAVKWVEFVSDRMSYIILRGRWCDVIILNIHARTKDKIYYMKDKFYEELERVFDKFPKYRKKILLGDFSTKVGRKDILKQIIWNESLHEISEDIGVSVANIATLKNLSEVQCSHIVTFIDLFGETHNQIDHMFIDRRWH
jgi:exonuclease III